MKIVAINGSPRKGGNIAQCLDVMAKEFEREGIERITDDCKNTD